jgi:TonB family protein
MKSWVLIILLAVGCATSEPPAANVQMPELVSQVPLPAPSRQLQGRLLKLELKIHVGEDGSVIDAAFTDPTGDLEWDNAALEKVRQWKFSPALYAGKPIAIWIRQSVVLQFSDPMMMSLAEIRCSEPSLADSVYAALVGGADFGTLARTFSVAPSAERGGVLGDVDIRTYPYAVQKELQDLKPGQFTRPIHLGTQIVLFLRMERAGPGNDGDSH